MKRILITGANSYIGMSLETYLSQWPDDYAVDTVDMISDGWRQKSFAGYDTVFHVAGLAHSDTKRVSEGQKAQYYVVNTDLAIATAKKAKAEGVGQFIFMSSIIVYGDSAPIGKTKVITKDTPPSPANFYGDSKLKAEEGLRPLSDDAFHVAILRPPMIYGEGCKGNYPTLVKLAKKLPLFPNVQNQRSMLYIGNLCEFLRLLIDNNERGLFFPQNVEYSCTSDLVKAIAEAHGRKLRLTKAFNWLLPLASRCTGLVDKAFGSLAYDMQMSKYRQNYWVCGTLESIDRTEAA